MALSTVPGVRAASVRAMLPVMARAGWGLPIESIMTLTSQSGSDGVGEPTMASLGMARAASACWCQPHPDRRLTPDVVQRFQLQFHPGDPAVVAGLVQAQVLGTDDHYRCPGVNHRDSPVGTAGSTVSVASPVGSNFPVVLPAGSWKPRPTR